MKRKFLTALLLLLLPVPAAAQVSITFTFVNGQAADADQVNTNFSVLGAQALNRTGGTITGNIAVSNGVTIDGIDIGAMLGGTGAGAFASLDVAGGIQAGSGNVNIIGADGRLAGLSNTYLANQDASGLTNLNAGQLANGTFVPNAALFGTYASVLSFTNTLNTLNAFTLTITAGGSSTLGASTATSLLSSGTIHGGNLIADTTLAAGGAITGNTLVTASTIRAAGGYLSADSTPGFTGTCAAATTATVKNGLITGCS